MAIKHKIAPFLYQYFDFIPTDKLIGKVGEIPFLPFYHAIGDEEELPHIIPLYPVRTKEEFSEDLDFILKYFEPVSLEEFIEFSKKQSFKKNGKPIFHLSFDDGLRSVFEVAMPILKKKGIPATLFLTTDFIDNRKLFFRHKSALIYSWLQRGGIDTSELSKFGITDVNIFNINSSHHPVFGSYEKEFDDFLKNKKPYLNFDEIESWIENGFTVGSHSLDHPHYSQLPLPEQIRQTEESINYIIDNFKLDYVSFSFPFTDAGVKKVFFQKLEKKKIHSTTFACAGLKKDPIPFHWQRVPMESGHKSALEIIRSEYLYSYFSKFVGRQKIIRG